MNPDYRLLGGSLMLALLFAACAANETNSSFYFSPKGIVRSYPSDAEIQEARKTLINWYASTPIPSEMKGGVLFDGTAVSMTTDSEGNHTATFDIKRTYLDASAPLGSKVDVITAPEDKGGVAFEASKIYRVYAVQLNGHYQTWTAAGTVKIGRD